MKFSLKVLWQKIPVGVRVEIISCSKTFVSSFLITLAAVPSVGLGKEAVFAALTAALRSVIAALINGGFGKQPVKPPVVTP